MYHIIQNSSHLNYKYLNFLISETMACKYILYVL
jgi:hypothetical protein